MASYRKPGPLGADGIFPDIEDGTTARAASPMPGPEGLRGRLWRKGSRGKHIEHVDRTAVGKARRDAIAMLTTRLNELDAWDKEVLRRGEEVSAGDSLPAECGAVRELLLGWFGTDDAAARSRIRNKLVKAIRKLKEVNDADFLPDRSSSDYAYVNPDSTERGKYEKTIHLGSAFWSADDRTRAGTLIHEVSHFVTAGGTVDFGDAPKECSAADFAGIDLRKYGGTYAAYGGARAARLAIRNPSMGLNNADSFEFFIEGGQGVPD